MKIPATITIGNQDWIIKPDVTERESGNDGSNYRGSQIISYDPHLHIQQQELAILHEILHACGSFAGMEDKDKLTEEEWVTRVTPILLAVLEKNKLF